MPLVTPNTGETKEKFMNRCMGNSGMNNEFPDQSQRYAVSRSIWEDKNFWTMPATIETYAKSKNVYATDAPFNCECIDCGHKMVSETAHCNELKCSECGGQMRRQNRPGVGQNALWQNNAPWNLVDPKFLELHDFSPKAMAFTDEPLTKGLTTFDPTIPLLRKRL